MADTAAMRPSRATSRAKARMVAAGWGRGRQGWGRGGEREWVRARLGCRFCKRVGDPGSRSDQVTNDPGSKQAEWRLGGGAGNSLQPAAIRRPAPAMGSGRCKDVVASDRDAGGGTRRGVRVAACCRTLRLPPPCRRTAACGGANGRRRGFTKVTYINRERAGKRAGAPGPAAGGGLGGRQAGGRRRHVGGPARRKASQLHLQFCELGWAETTRLLAQAE